MAIKHAPPLQPSKDSFSNTKPESDPDDEAENGNEQVLDEMIVLVRKTIWNYFDLMEQEKIDIVRYGRALEIIGRAAARLGRLIEIRRKSSTEEDGASRFRQAVAQIIDDLDQSMLFLKEGNDAERI